MADGNIQFDFEQSLHSVPAQAVAPPTDLPPAMRKNYRQTVCRHWWRGLCMKGDNCGFLHQWEPSRMPICRFFAKNGECHEANCVFKHSMDDVKDCNMYKLGFCIHGSLCRYRHQKMPGPPPAPIDMVRTKATDLEGEGAPQQAQQQQFMALPSTQPGTSQPNASAGALVVHQPTASAPHLYAKGVSKAQPPPAGSTRYFLIKSNGLANLEKSVRHGVWATHKLNEQKLNAAWGTCDNTLLLFSVNESRHFQGLARQESLVGDEAPMANPHFQGAYGRNFKLKWLKLADLSFARVQHLNNPYNDNKPVKVGRDCQEIEPSVGAQLLAMLYSLQDSALMPLVDEGEPPPGTKLGDAAAGGRAGSGGAATGSYRSGGGGGGRAPPPHRRAQPGRSMMQRPAPMGGPPMLPPGPNPHAHLPLPHQPYHAPWGGGGPGGGGGMPPPHAQQWGGAPPPDHPYWHGGGGGGWEGGERDAKRARGDYGHNY